MSQDKRPETISILELFDLFGSDHEAEEWFINARWPNGLRCAFCNGERVGERGNHPTQRFHCSDCRKFFSVKSNSVLHSSKLGYQKLAVAYYLFVMKPKGMSSIQLSKELGVNQRTAWHLGHRIRKALENDPESLFIGPVEVDETFIGGRARNQTYERKRRLRKIPIIGLRDRATNLVKAEPIPAASRNWMQEFVYSNTKQDAMVYTDDAPGYKGLKRLHETETHSKGEYGLTNGIESFWAIFKRAYKGSYHVMSHKHIRRYTTEIQERHNRRPLGTLERMASVVAGGVGKRLRFVDLVREERVPQVKLVRAPRIAHRYEDFIAPSKHQVKIAPIDIEAIKARARARAR